MSPFPTAYSHVKEMGFALTYASESNPVLPLTRHQLAHKVTAASLISHCYLTVVFSKPERFLGANLTVHALPQSPGFVLVFPTCLYCPVRLMSLLMANYVCVYLETGPVLSFIKYPPLLPRTPPPLFPLARIQTRAIVFTQSAYLSLNFVASALIKQRGEQLGSGSVRE